MRVLYGLIGIIGCVIIIYALLQPQPEFTSIRRCEATNGQILYIEGDLSQPNTFVDDITGRTWNTSQILRCDADETEV